MPQQELSLKIDGMHCDGCVRRVTLALSKVPGVQVDSVEVGSARLHFDEAEAKPLEIADAVNRIGFVATRA
jgi:copper chaperone